MDEEKFTQLKRRLSQLEKDLQQLKKEIQSMESGKKPSLALPLENPPLHLESKKNGLDWEILIAGNWIGKTGILAIILATLWFLDLAFSKDWITDSGKIALGLLGGFGMISLGLFYAKLGYKILSPALLGSGFSILYLAIFSAYRFYTFFGVQETFLYLLILGWMLVFFSRLARSETLYGFGLTGCVLLPILLSTGESSYPFFFTYMAVNLILFGWLSHGLGWKWASLLVFASQWIVVGVWTLSPLASRVFWIPVLFIVFLAGFFPIREHFLEKQANKRIHPFFPGFLTAGSFGLGGVCLSQIFHLHFPEIPDLEGLPYLSMAVVGSFVGISVPKEESKFQRIPVLLYSIYSSVLMSLLVTVSDSWIGLALIGFAFVFSYSFGKCPNLSFASFHSVLEYFIWVVVVLRVVLNDGLRNDNPANTFIWNQRFPYLSSLVFAMTFLYFQNCLDYKRNVRTKFFGLLSLFLLIWTFLTEVHFYIQDPHLRNLSYSLVLGIFAGVFLIWGIYKKIHIYRKIGLVLILLMIFKFILYDIWFLSLVFKIFSGFGLGAFLILLGLYYEKIKSNLLGEKDEKS